MTNTCPACGASLRPGESCQAIFDCFLALEFSDPAFGAVHFLTVACFMLQHGRYSDQAAAWVADALVSYLDGDVQGKDLLAFARRGAASPARTWPILRPADSPAASPMAWTITIADVAHRYHDAASYRASITEWAGSIRRQLRR